MQWSKVLFITMLSFILALGACSGSGSTSNTAGGNVAGGNAGGTNNAGGGNTGGGVSLTGVVVMSIVDANKKPVTNATVNVTPKNATTTLSVGAINQKAIGNSASFTTDPKGNMNIKGLQPGKYVMEVKSGTGKTKTEFEISSSAHNDGKESASIIIAASQDVYGNIKPMVNAIVASISGNIRDFAANTALQGVTVTLSTPKLGMIASDTTDANGFYTLILNISKKNASELLQTKVTLSLKGFNEHQVSGLQMFSNTNLNGFDFALVAQTASQAATTAAAVIYAYDFEAGMGSWTPTSLWHTHTSNLNIKNAAVTAGLVNLAPDDTTAGFIPNPTLGNKAMWFGGNLKLGFAKGNFMGTSDVYTNVQGAKNGGQTDSIIASMQGDLTSPIINLTAVTNPYVSLTFDTWWEIESVNPNNNGFDLMTISYSTDGAITWTALARLNPLTDPYTDIIRDPIPYSNNGFNAAPSWVHQESIPLIDPYTGNSLAGQNIQLRFGFDTVDNLYNGFRGWMIDNVSVELKKGTYTTIDPFAPIGGAALYDWINPVWNPTTGALSITPAVWNATTGAAATLATGQATNINAIFEYEAVNAVSGQLLVAIDGAAPQAIVGSSLSLVTPGLQQITLSGSITPSLGSTTVDIWVQMNDVNGAEVMSMPVASYFAQ